MKVLLSDLGALIVIVIRRVILFMLFQEDNELSQSSYPLSLVVLIYEGGVVVFGIVSSALGMACAGCREHLPIVQ